MPQGSPVAASLPASTGLPKLIAARSLPVGARSETAKGAMDVVQKGSGREPHLLEERLPARIGMQAAQHRLDFHDAETRIALPVRALEPVEGKIRLPAVGVSECDLIGAPVCVLLDQCLKCRP